ncbi:hypothetical protein POSPLADRAFT_1032533 [Postia placenta MAD-698-R-SB12]|uniref:Uncharacterized protein n=1 Tax=Postia placenta MAD-698-R-SB12 TaxID=670580 RepID=A0A1X6N5Y0_9APHY|nr:hypothetical protein POSPLADRAFT_1032533 [Postia placenta MAD-698-R-SB12]OSX64059.1 hypothetical protein POSPLADRAFT_1032533 [Postia placenta MAD-698-R-SB12]
MDQRTSPNGLQNESLNDNIGHSLAGRIDGQNSANTASASFLGKRSTIEDEPHPDEHSHPSAGSDTDNETAAKNSTKRLRSQSGIRGGAPGKSTRARGRPPKGASMSHLRDLWPPPGPREQHFFLPVAVHSEANQSHPNGDAKGLTLNRPRGIATRGRSSRATSSLPSIRGLFVPVGSSCTPCGQYFPIPVSLDVYEELINGDVEPCKTVSPLALSSKYLMFSSVAELDEAIEYAETRISDATTHPSFLPTDQSPDA